MSGAWVVAARDRLIARGVSLLPEWVRIAKLRDRAVPSTMHRAIAMAREICKPSRPVHVSDGFAYDGGHYWPGGAYSVILALAWAGEMSNAYPEDPGPYLFSAVIDAGWRSKHECGSRLWYEAVERAWKREASQLPMPSKPQMELST